MQLYRYELPNYAGKADQGTALEWCDANEADQGSEDGQQKKQAVKKAYLLYQNY